MPQLGHTKRALLIFGFVVIGVIIWVARPSGSAPTWKPATRFTFLGFTNSVAGAPATNAWVGIMDIPKEDTSWSTVSISHREGTEWKMWEPLPNPSFSWQNPKPDKFHLGAIIPVPATNAPVRVVIELHSIERGIVRKFFDARGIHWAWLKHWPAALGGVGRGSTFLITNEFNGAAETKTADR